MDITFILYLEHRTDRASRMTDSDAVGNRITGCNDRIASTMAAFIDLDKEILIGRAFPYVWGRRPYMEVNRASA